MNNRLTELIERKSFGELSKEEQSFVLDHISEQEFNEKHALISQVKNELKAEAGQLKANDSIHLNALAALRAKQQLKEAEKKEKAGFFTLRIPLWTAIAAVFMIFILTTPLFINSGFEQKNNNELIASVDTVYIDKIMRDTVEIIKPADTVVKTVYVSDEVVANKDISFEEFESKNRAEQSRDVLMNRNENIHNEIEMRMEIGGYANAIDFKNPKSGRSLSEDKIGKVVLDVVN